MRITPLAVVPLAALAANAQPSFHPLGDLAGGTSASNAWRVADDGAAIAGSATIDSGLIAQRTTTIDAMARLGRLPGFTDASDAYAISALGRVVVGYSALADTSEAYYWTADAGMVSIGDLPGGAHSSQAYGVSADGNVIVGVADYVNQWPVITGQAFRWTEAGGMVGLGYSQPHHDLSIAYAASADGSVIVGMSFKNLSDGEAFVWKQSTGMVGLGDIAGGPDNYSVAADVTPDGTVVVGGCSPPGGYEAFRWTQAGGMVPLGDLPGGEHDSYASAVTADGNTIVGDGNWDGQTGDAFIWDPVNGIRALQTVLENDDALDLTGWRLMFAQDISADGRYIVGQGLNPDGNLEAWIVDLAPAPCPADFNGDGVVNTLDVLSFLNAWVAGC